MATQRLATLLALAACPALQQAADLRSQRPDLGQKTFQGCACRTECGAGIADLYDCDRCKTADGCGNFGLGGRWDYCAYPEDRAFEVKTFQEKSAYFWAKIVADATRAAEYPNVLGLLATSVQTSFDNGRDEMPSGRVKYIHSVGSVCKFKLEISRYSPYTGLLGPGVQEGFVRMGSAADYRTGGLTPGLGFKFARSGVHSGGFVTLHSLDLGQSWNFFRYNQSNHLSPASGMATAVLSNKFNQVSQCAPQVGISDLARYSQDGTEHETPRFPFKLFLVVGEAVQTPEVKKTPDQVHAEMAAFPVGTTLYTVYACDRAAGEAEMAPVDGGLERACASPILLGPIVITSACTTSAYGDAKFQIRHQRIEEDWQLRPDFLEQYDAARACGWNGKVTPQGAPKVCGAESSGGMLASDLVVGLAI